MSTLAFDTFRSFLVHAALVKPVHPAASPDPLPAAWLGIDRDVLPKTGKNDNPNWLGLLIDNSNLRLCGAYLEGPPLPAPASAGNFTGSTKQVSRRWIPNVTTLRGQGWGIVFFYVGYSAGKKTGEPLPSTTKDPNAGTAARGQLHAQHAKTIISTIAPTLDGAVIYLDNEDFEGTSVASLLDYYGGFFDELQKPGPGDLPALRIGLYAHGKIAAQFLADRPHLFIWEVAYETATTKTPVAPFNTTDKPLRVGALRTRTLKPISVGASNAWIAWPPGQQFRSYTGKMPIAKSPLALAVPALNPIATWDYDSALVRDPSYPEAEPRIALAPGPIVIAGRFSARTVGGAGDPPHMIIDKIDSAGRSSLALEVTVPLKLKFPEPDAPIVSATFPGTTRSDFASLLTTGDIAAFSSDAGTWSPIGSITAAPPAMRRLRAMALAAFAADERQLFFVGSDRLLYGSRQKGATPWTTPAALGTFTVHPFSNLAAATRLASASGSAASVDVFALSSDGLLSTISWNPAMATWPGSQSQALETAASLLTGTSLAAISATPDKLHVFGVGADRRLKYAEWTDGSGWGAVTTIGATSPVSPHTRLAVHAPSPTRVEVAAVSDQGWIRIYALEASGGIWTEQPSLTLNNPAALAPKGYTPPPAASPTENAYGWRINPFGDLAIGSVAGITTVFAAGIKPGQTAVMRRSTATGSTWEFYRQA
jgi:hypothetical protein